MLPEIFGQGIRIDGRANGELTMRMAELVNNERVIHLRAAPLGVLRVIHLRFRHVERPGGVGSQSLREIERVFLKFGTVNDLIDHAVLLGLRG